MGIIKKLFKYAIIFVLLILFDGLVINWIYRVRIKTLKWKPNTEIQLSAEDVGHQDYQVYSREWHFWKWGGNEYIIVTRHRIPNKKARAISKQEQFDKGNVAFYWGPKWLKWDRNYKNGQRWGQ